MGGVVDEGLDAASVQEEFGGYAICILVVEEFGGYAVCLGFRQRHPKSSRLSEA